VDPGDVGVRAVSVRARFERFPATVKGAFILRGEDADPHQVVVREATVVGIGLGSRYPMPVPPVTLDVAPHRDVFVPFEMAVGELDPGWYTMTCDLDVDGYRASFDGGRRFCMPWPRSTVRRGPVKVGRRVAVGRSTVLVEQLDCAGDSVTVHLRVDPPASISAKLFADADPLVVLDTDVDESTGAGTVTTYPVLRAQSTIRLRLQGRRRGEVGELEVELPG
jgi:hypothetical protein